MAEVLPTRICVCCNRDLPASSEYFSSNKQSRDGFGSWCKKCVNEYNYNNRNSKKTPAQRRKEKGCLCSLCKIIQPLTEFVGLYCRTCKQSQRKKYIAQQKPKDRIKYAVHVLTQHAIDLGLLIRPSACSRCNEPGTVQAHHHQGYTLEHALDVKWLCPRCHHQAHS